MVCGGKQWHVIICFGLWWCLIPSHTCMYNMYLCIQEILWTMLSNICTPNTYTYMRIAAYKCDTCATSLVASISIGLSGRSCLPHFWDRWPLPLFLASCDWSRKLNLRWLPNVFNWRQGALNSKGSQMASAVNALMTALHLGVTLSSGTPSRKGGVATWMWQTPPSHQPKPMVDTHCVLPLNYRFRHFGQDRFQAGMTNECDCRCSAKLFSTKMSGVVVCWVMFGVC